MSDFSLFLHMAESREGQASFHVALRRALIPFMRVEFS